MTVDQHGEEVLKRFLEKEIGAAFIAASANLTEQPKSRSPLTVQRRLLYAFCPCKPGKVVTDSSKLIALEQRAAITYWPFIASFRKHDAHGSPQIVLSSQKICSLMTESSVLSCWRSKVWCVPSACAG